jgi:lipid A 4'-phosphatase
VKVLFVFMLALLSATLAWPSLDPIVSGWFYQPGRGFFLADRPVFLFLHWLAVEGAWALGIVLALLTVVAAFRRKPVLGFAVKEWLFLLFALLLGPVLVANYGLKDHWGRARPREIIEFGGSASFSPALAPQPAARKNGSFVAGDAAFGFYLPNLAYIVPLRPGRRLSRHVFLGGLMAGGLFGLARLAMGAHFLSDILCAAILMLLLSAGLHALIFGFRSTLDYWREWMGLKPDGGGV